MIEKFYKLHKLRAITRRLGLNSILFNFFFGNKNYEENFDESFSRYINKGDVVYDCGANIGHYTKTFADLVGSEGLVIGIEPSPMNYKKLMKNTSNYKNIVNLNFALGKKKELLWFQQGEDEIGANSKVLEDKTNNSIKVDVFTLSEIIDLHGEPNAIKIDVEGFEFDVLLGLEKKLAIKNSINLIGIEVHSSILETRGIKNAQKKIEKFLIDKNYSINWTDFSHIIAKKNA